MLFSNSKGFFSVEIFILGASARPRARGLAFLVGGAISVFMLGVLIILSGKAVFDLRAPKTASAIIDIAIGLMLIAVGIFAILKKRNIEPKRIEPQDVTGSMSTSLYKIAALGALLCITNTSSLVFYLAAAKRTSETNLGLYEKIAAIAFVGLFFLLPIIIPLSFTLVAPVKSKRILENINEVIRDYGSILIIFVALAFGFFLIGKGIMDIFIS